MVGQDARRQCGIAPGLSGLTDVSLEEAVPGLESDQLRRLSQLQEENGRLKRLVADLTLDVTPQARRSLTRRRPANSSPRGAAARASQLF